LYFCVFLVGGGVCVWVWVGVEYVI
jgi:hypothetical protein